MDFIEMTSVSLCASKPIEFVKEKVKPVTSRVDFPR